VDDQVRTSTPPPNIVIYCEGTTRDPHEREVVEVARFLRGQRVWVLGRSGDRAVAYVQPDGSTTGDANTAPDHETWQVRCAKCRRGNPVRGKRLGLAAWWLVAQRMTTVPLFVFQEAVRRSGGPTANATPECYNPPAGVI